MTDPSYRESLEFLANLLPELAMSESAAGVRPPLPLVDASALVPPITEAGRPLAEVLEVLAELARRVPLTTTPKFFNQLFSGRDAVATVADMLAAHLNVSMYTYKAAGPLVLAENALVEHMLGLAGFNGGEGSFTTGGSLSNLLAIAIARNEAEAQHSGPRRQLGLYTSGESHYSVAKAVTLLGLGRGATRKIPTDEQGRMRPDLLAATLRDDIDAGILPVMINATAGTTVMGAFDPIDELADIAREHRVWIHVDGAWGGALLLLPDARRRLFAGLERCNSLTWDAHKIMGVPLTCSILLLRERGLLERHLGEDAEYLFQVDTPELNPGLRSIQCGRRNDALKLWAAWQHHGDAGYRARVERLLALRDHVVSRIEASPELRMCHVPESLNVCFEMPGVSSEQLCSELNARGLAVVGHARVNGDTTIRLVIANPAQSEAVLDEFVAAVLQVGADLRAQRVSGER
jgi:sulfinoalanine decarboxylase/sulfinoalanine decarboxylase/aspartate 1-decarboxylase